MVIRLSGKVWHRIASREEKTSNYSLDRSVTSECQCLFLLTSAPIPLNKFQADTEDYLPWSPERTLWKGSTAYNLNKSPRNTFEEKTGKCHLVRTWKVAWMYPKKVKFYTFTLTLSVGITVTCTWYSESSSIGQETASSSAVDPGRGVTWPSSSQSSSSSSEGVSEGGFLTTFGAVRLLCLISPLRKT